MTSGKRVSGRQKIVDAASELAQVTGPGNLSLDAVAARAGVSKGGLLYHFPSKTKLLEAMVAQFVEGYSRELAARESEKGASPNGLMAAYLDLFVEQHDCNRPPPASILAALAENSDFLAPVRRHERELLDRMIRESADPATALITYLVIHGIRSMELLSLDTLHQSEMDSVLARLRRMIGEEDQVSGGTGSADRCSRSTT